jgi:bifunctional DNase/RNase
VTGFIGRIRNHACVPCAAFARPSDALNLAALVQAPIFAAPEVLREAEARREGDTPGAARLRRALVTPPMTVGTVGM